MTADLTRAPRSTVGLVYVAALLQGMSLVAVPALSPILKGTLRLSDAEYGAVFLMGAQAALYGPSKFGSLPELLRADRLAAGNGICQAGG